MSALKLAGIIRESIVDGPGIRFVVFAQGCPHQCPGCHNQQTWPFAGGFEAEPRTILTQIQKNPLLRGVTLSGGEPFCQSGAMAELAKLSHACGLTVITYTGFLYETLTRKAKEDPDVGELLRQTDILIDGPFLQDQKSYELSFRGSANQRAIDVKQSLETKTIVLAKL